MTQANAELMVQGDEDKKAQIPTSVDYFIQVMVSPDDPAAGTTKPVNMRLEGSSAQMAESVTLAPGLSLGETLNLVISATDVGQANKLELTMNDPGDPVLIEICSLDQFPENDENGEQKYINFPNAADPESWISAEGGALGLSPSANYVVTIRTSNFLHGGTGNAISIKFIGEAGDSSVMVISESGFKQAESYVADMYDEVGSMVTNIVACVISVNYKEDDVWLPDTIFVNTPTQRAVFRNSDSMFIGFKPQKLFSDKIKNQIAREERASGKDKPESKNSKPDFIKELIAALQ